ncbi:hypothetical protein MUP95_06295, partial [bacterium]|nr:hypothetical protein [bacterium]
MAIVQFSAFVNDVRGRIGELVHTAHCGVHYVKAYCANPTDPNTARQQQVRKIFGDLSKAY